MFKALCSQGVKRGRREVGMGLTPGSRVDQSPRAPSKQAWREGEKWWQPAPESKRRGGTLRWRLGNWGLLRKDWELLEVCTSTMPKEEERKIRTGIRDTVLGGMWPRMG